MSQKEMLIMQKQDQKNQQKRLEIIIELVGACSDGNYLSSL